MNDVHYTRKNAPKELLGHHAWPEVDMRGWPQSESSVATSLRQAIADYLDWKCVRPTLQALGLSHGQLLERVNRCMAPHPDGRIYGWRALEKHSRVKEYERRAPLSSREYSSRSGYAGALRLLFNEYPTIEGNMIRYLRTGRRGDSLPDSKATKKAAHAYFLALCRDARIPQSRWPFCTVRYGRGAVERWVTSYFHNNYDVTVLKQHGERAAARSRTGTGRRSLLEVLRPYDVVELDEHRAHFIGSIGIDTPGGRRWVPIGRVTLIAGVDRVSGAVLGYSVTFRHEATGDDVLRAAASMMRPLPLRQLQEGLHYPEGAGYPSSAIPGAERCGFNLLLLDSALVHMTRGVMGRLRDISGAAINYGPVRRFERRPIGELVFGEISRAGFHRITSTTGSHPKDPRRREPEAAACKMKMGVEDLLDLIDMVIAHYNGNGGRRNFGIGGIEFMREIYADSKFLAPTLPPPQPHIPDLDVCIQTAKISGSAERGNRPHVWLDEARYTSPELARRWDLLGSTVTLHINPDNMQTVDAFTEDGASLGTLEVLGRWAGSPHSRETRRHINFLERSGELIVDSSQDPVAIWLQNQAQKAIRKQGTRRPTSSREAMHLAREVHAGNVKEDELQCDPNASPVCVDESASDAVRRHGLDADRSFDAFY